MKREKEGDREEGENDDFNGTCFTDVSAAFIFLRLSLLLITSLNCTYKHVTSTFMHLTSCVESLET